MPDRPFPGSPFPGKEDSTTAQGLRHRSVSLKMVRARPPELGYLHSIFPALPGPPPCLSTRCEPSEERSGRPSSLAPHPLTERGEGRPGPRSAHKTTELMIFAVCTIAIVSMMGAFAVLAGAMVLSSQGQQLPFRS